MMHSQMASAVAKASMIDPAACRRRVEQLFSTRRMASDYESLYQRVMAQHRVDAAA